MKEFLKKFLPLPANSAIRQTKELIHHTNLLEAKVDTLIETVRESTAAIRKISRDLKLCPVCMTVSQKFNLSGNPPSPKKCPSCKSIGRHRFLWMYLERNEVFSPTRGGGEIKVLHFAPEKSFYNKFSALPNVDYYPVDFAHEFGNYRGVKLRDVIDITKINYPDDMFDIIICNHVLEHVDDYVAMNELFRVLKKGGEGRAFIMVPISHDLETTIENPEFNTPELRQEHYGQPDHVRRYGKDFSDRMRKTGFSVDVVDANTFFSRDEMNLYHIGNQEIYVASIKCGGVNK